MPTGHTTIASWRQPEGGYARHSPLPTVTVSAKNQVNGMMSFHIVEDVRGMGQQQCKTRGGARGDTAKIRAMKRWIIDTDNREISISR